MSFLTSEKPPLALAFLCAASLATAQVDTFHARLGHLVDAYHLPGLSAAVLHGDSVVYAEGFGYADRERRTPATPHTNYYIASLTKPLAATALLQLVGEGRLRLDDSVKAIVPGYEDYYREVSGYILANAPQYASLVEDFDFERDDLTVRHHLTHTAEGIPGTGFKYNGFLFGALARVMEVIEDRDFADILRARVLAPAGMTRTLASRADSSLPEAHSVLALPYGYEGATGEFTRAPDPDPGVNAGAGVLSNVLDLLAFDRAIDGDALLPPALRDNSRVAQRNEAGEALPYGLGWFVQEGADGRRLLWHYGWEPGAYSALYLKLPDSGLTLVLLANGENLTAPFTEEGYRTDVTASAFARLFLDTFGAAP